MSSSASSPGAVSRVVGYSTTDPTTTFVRGIHTLKNGSYYKRSWTSGSPYSSVPIWLARRSSASSSSDPILRSPRCSGFSAGLRR
jgi:hypothetical protein